MLKKRTKPLHRLKAQKANVMTKDLWLYCETKSGCKIDDFCYILNI